MTDDVWYHALQFLDKYSSDYENADRSELYEFANDATGVLNRHRHRLYQPFSEKEVELKVVYSELIKMLLEKEKESCPQVITTED